MDRIKVVTLIDFVSSGGGAEQLAIEVTRRLDPTRFEPTFCASRSQPGADVGGLVKELEAAGARVLQLGRSSALDVGAWRPLASLLRNERIDVLHAHKFGSNVWGTVLGRVTGVPVVVAHEHTWSFQGKPLRRLLDRYLIGRHADVFVAVSAEDRRRMIELEGVPSERVVLVPNGPPERARAGTDIRAELGASETAPLVGVVAGLRAQKALDVLIRAAKDVTQAHPEVRVVLVGEGEERNSLEALVRQLGLEDTVILLGHRSDVPDIIAALDVAVCCSDFEGSPLAVMEYMAAGKPIVATAVGGLPELLRDGIDGLLVPPREPATLAIAISHLLGAREEAQTMGERARLRQQQSFSLGASVRRLEDLYETLLAAKRGPRGKAGRTS